MNTQIRTLGIVLMVLFGALFIQLNNLQVFGAAKLNHHPANTRTVVRDFSQARGSIQTSDGVVVAESVDVDDAFKRQRRYPEGALFAHITGYFSFTFGDEGVERTYNDALTGRDRKVTFDRLGDILLEKDKTANLTLTVSKSLQQIASDGLAGRKGSVVAIDPRDGSVLALADYPAYDPNVLASHNQDDVRKAWAALNTDENAPLLPRTYRERYFPGSSFKVVTAAAALAAGSATLTQPIYPTLTDIIPPQTTEPLRNFGGEACGGPLPQILKVSCNTAFAQLGLDMGGQKLAAGANQFGFNKMPPIDLPFGAQSVFPDPSSFVHDLPALAKSAIGQQDVQATPLEMALVAAGIANNGVIMTPHVMADVRDSKAEVLEKYSPKPWLQATPPEVAHAVRDMMVGVVAAGTGTGAQIPGVTVAGKTGTAQTGLGTSHTWFIAFAPAEAPRVAVAVMLENQPGSTEFTGGAIAAPIARSVLTAALGAA